MTLQDYNSMQIREIERYKWIESEKAGRDLGEAAVVNWIMNFAQKFRKEHEIEE
ncbi:MAG: hypothetical protein HQL32_05165 [Planctomycetes bacterium]|nr:hypothetical protein [Planctomycetota bacterium]